MMPVYIVNLRRHSARRNLMTGQCDRLGITPVWIDAVDASNPTPEEAELIQALPAWGPWGEVSGHAKGCTLSHLAAYREFLTTGSRYACVLEDDVFLSEDTVHWLTSDEWIPDGVDVIKLERWRDHRLYVMLGKRSLIYRDRVIKTLFSKHSGSAGYLISKGAALRILTDPKPDTPIDHLLFHPNVSRFARTAKVLQVQPALVEQGNDPQPDTTAIAEQRELKKKGPPLRQILMRAYAEISFLHNHVVNFFIRGARPEKIRWSNK